MRPELYSDLILTATFALLGGITVILGVYIGAKLVAPSLAKERRGTLDQRLTRLTSALNDSAQTIKEIEAGMAERQELANQLKKDVETYEHLKSIKGPEMEAVARVLSGELEKEGRRSLWRDILLFAAGVIVTVLTSLFLG